MTITEDKTAELLARYETMGLAVDAALHHVGPELVVHGVCVFGSLRKLAKAIGLSPTYLSQVRNRKLTISGKSFTRLYEALSANERT